MNSSAPLLRCKVMPNSFKLFALLAILAKMTVPLLKT
jgi:hypothetical protein